MTAARTLLAIVALAVTLTAEASAAPPAWDVSGRWTSFIGDLELGQAPGGALSGNFQMKTGCTETYNVTGRIDGSSVSLDLARSRGEGDELPCAGKQTLKGTVGSGGTTLNLALENFARTSPPTPFSGRAKALLTTDRTPPKVQVLPSTGLAGDLVELNFRVSDDSGKAELDIAVSQEGKAIFRRDSQRYLPAEPGGTQYGESWRVPATLAGAKLQWCVIATDPSGNSAKDCAAIVLRGGTRPSVQALPGTGLASGLVSLDFRVSDQSGKAKRTVTLSWGGRLIWENVGGALLPAKAGATYAEQWRAPANLAGAKLQFCVIATNAGGNSAKDCAALTLTRDRTRPRVEALPASGRPGKRVDLRYTVRDESGQTSEVIRIYAYSGQRLIGVTSRPFGLVGRLSVPFTLPMKPQPGLTFCVEATDGTGNKSAKSCAAIRLT